MSELKKYTRLGSNSRQLAALLQAKAPPGHILAYISPQEAQLLKARGGSGKEHAGTGILSFEEEFTDYGGEIDSTAVSGGEVPAPSEYPSFEPGSAAYLASEAQTVGLPEITQGLPSADVGGGRTPYGGGVDLFAGEQVETPVFAPPSYSDYGAPTGFGAPGTSYETAGAPSVAGTEEAAPAAPGAGKGMSKDMMAKLGIAGVGGLLGGLQARRAAAQGQAGKREMAALAQPYATKGAELRGAAERGELTPQAQRAVQAARAQLAQGAERRGGVGVQQAEAQIQALTQNLLQQQYDLGLKLSGISDNIMMGAIKTGLQADQYANQLTANYFGNIARTVYGATTARE